MLAAVGGCRSWPLARREPSKSGPSVVLTADVHDVNQHAAGLKGPVELETAEESRPERRFGFLREFHSPRRLLLPRTDLGPDSSEKGNSRETADFARGF